MALNVWGYYLINKKIVSVAKSYARLLVLACLEFNILLKSVHIPDYLNSLPDSLSSCNFQKFLRLCPTADINLCAIPSHLSSPIYRRHIKQQKKFLTSSAWFISSIMFGQYQLTKSRNLLRFFQGARSNYSHYLHICARPLSQIMQSLSLLVKWLEGLHQKKTPSKIDAHTPISFHLFKS